MILVSFFKETVFWVEFNTPVLSILACVRTVFYALVSSLKKFCLLSSQSSGLTTLVFGILLTLCDASL